MESLNIKSNLNPSEQEVNPPKVTNWDYKTLTNPAYDYHCEYRDDIWKNLLEREGDKPIIHFRSPQLVFRGTLVQHLRDVTKKLGMNIATLHCAVAQLDLFMDGHRLRSDRLFHVALACLSLAAKSEEKFSSAFSLNTLSKVAGTYICGKTFRQLEWMIGQYVRWSLLAPTPVTFAALLSQFVVTDADLVTRHPKFVRRFKKDAAKILDEYLDVTLSDVRLKVMESVDVGCACVACARVDLGLSAWPEPLAAAAGRPYTSIAPIARRLQRLMQMLKARETNTDSQVDKGVISARTSPNLTVFTSTYTPPVTTATVTASTTSYINVVSSFGQYPINPPDYVRYTKNSVPLTQQKYPSHPVDMTCQKVNNPSDYRYCKSRRLLDSSQDTAQPSTSMTVKRGLDSNGELEKKRYRVANVAGRSIIF